MDFVATAPLTRFEMGPPGKTDPLLSYKLVDELVYSPRVLGVAGYSEAAAKSAWETVYSPRVLEAAGYSEAAAKASWIRSQLQQPLLGGPAALLSLDLEYDVGDIQTKCFSATLNRAYKGKRKHSDVDVVVDVSHRRVKLHGQSDGWAQVIPLALAAPDMD
ncbi:hypothetical protein OEZ86_005328 [Tetradesmus obliquus]|nr:hypothetical protein OEZ86_005328 [Tetradesmus obliquus]